MFAQAEAAYFGQVSQGFMVLGGELRIQEIGSPDIVAAEIFSPRSMSRRQPSGDSAQWRVSLPSLFLAKSSKELVEGRGVV